MQEAVDRRIAENPSEFLLGSLPVRGTAAAHFERRDTGSSGSARPPEPADPTAERRERVGGPDQGRGGVERRVPSRINEAEIDVSFGGDKVLGTIDTMPPKGKAKAKAKAKAVAKGAGIPRARVRLRRPGAALNMPVLRRPAGARGEIGRAHV